MTGNVSIKLYQGFVSQGHGGRTTPNDGSFDWTVPAALVPGSYNLLITWLSKTTVTGTSDEFTVSATGGPFTVTPELPVAQGGVRNISWSGIPETGNVSIKLYLGTVLKATVVATTPNDGSFDWTVPATLAAKLATGEAIKYTLRVTWLSKSTVFGTSAEFAVDETTRAFAVTNPA